MKLTQNSRYLKTNHRYDAAFSTCKSCLFLLPKIVEEDRGCFCLVHGFITTKALPSYEFLLNQTLIAIEIPRQFQLSYHILTPEIGQTDIRLPVVWIEDKLDWIKPDFTASCQSLIRDDEDLDQRVRDNLTENPFSGQYLT